jgi:hypothetical protein
MDSLYDLLAGKNFDEPPEVQAIKKFVRDTYKADTQVTVRDRDIVVAVSSAALTKKRIILRIQQSR